MRLILKLIAAPFIVLLTVLVAVLLFLFSVSSFLLTATSIIMALLGVVLEAYCKSLGKEYPQFAFRINREEVYADAGEHDFVTLESFGEEIGEHVG